MISLRLALILSTLAAGAARADPEAFRVSGVEPGYGLNIREEPDTGAVSLALMPWNARQVRGFGCTKETPTGTTWCRVKYEGVVGWARRQFLQPE